MLNSLLENSAVACMSLAISGRGDCVPWWNNWTGSIRFFWDGPADTVETKHSVMLRFHLSHHLVGFTPGQASTTMSTSLHGSIVKEQAVHPQTVPGLRWLGKEEKEESAACVPDSASPRLVNGLQVAQLSQSDSNHMDSTSQRNLSARKNFFTTCS